MNLKPSQCRDSIISYSRQLGITRIGFAKATLVDEDAQQRYLRWIEDGRHGEMRYLERYNDVRNDPRLLLSGAQSIICCAVNYNPKERQNADAPQIAAYALGKDYHEVVRGRLMQLVSFMKENYGGDYRVCVDTAPIRERYWAVKAGIGYVALNNQLVIPGCGSYFFLGEIITTLRLPENEPCTMQCTQCGACVKACPGKAIGFDGCFDARRCLSYLTIEYRGELTEGVQLGNRVYGCDTCQMVCPLNKTSEPTEIDDFTPSRDLLELDRQAMENLTPEQFSRIFRHSAVKRTKYQGFMRNLKHMK